MLKIKITTLDREEFVTASKLYSKGLETARIYRQEKFKELLDYYNDLIGFEETEPNVIMHHSLEQIGPDCENCGKPYRIPKATICMMWKQTKF